MTFRRLYVTSSHRKYDLVLKVLPQDVIITIRVVNNITLSAAEVPPSFQLCSSRWVLINRLLDTLTMGGRRPSVLMVSMLSLLPQDEPAGSVFLSLFLCCLPQNMQDHLATRQFDSPTRWWRLLICCGTPAATDRPPPR